MSVGPEGRGHAPARDVGGCRRNGCREHVRVCTAACCRPGSRAGLPRHPAHRLYRLAARFDAARRRAHRLGLVAEPLDRCQRKPFGAGLVDLSGRLPGRTQTQIMLLRLAPDNTVPSVEASLLGDLIPARAAEAYDQSGVYDIVARILGRRCPGLERLALYRFIDPVVNPRIKMERRDLSAGLLGRHRLTARAADVPWCGAQFTYTTYVEWTGSNTMQSGR